MQKKVFRFLKKDEWSHKFIVLNFSKKKSESCWEVKLKLNFISHFLKALHPIDENYIYETIEIAFH